MTGQDGLLMRTPAYCPLESPLHYILRLSEANGYTTPTVVMHLAAADEDWRVLAHWDCEHLNNVLPTCRHTPSTFTYRWPSSDHRCDLSLLGQPMLSRHLNARHAGVCPECVSDLGFAPAWWDIRCAIACPTHRRMFVFRCPSCGKRLSHLRRGLLRCSCGATLATGIEEEPCAALLWLMSLLQQKAEARSFDAKTTQKSERPLRPEQTDLGTLCRIIETIGKAEHRLSGSGDRRWPTDAQRMCLPAVASFLYDWPKGVFAFCSRWREHTTSQREALPRLRTAFPWAFHGLLRNQGQHRRDTLFIIDAILQYAASELPGRAVDIRAVDLQQLEQQEHAYCGVTRAAEISGIPRQTMIRLIRRKRVPCRVGHRGTRMIYEIKTEITRKLRLDYQPALLHRQGSRYLGVTHNLYRDLRNNGILKKVHETMMPAAFAVCDLEAFKQCVLAHAQKAAGTKGLESLDRLRLKKCPRNAMMQIIERIRRGSIPCFHTGAVPQRINDLFVRAMDVDPIIATFSLQPPPTLAEFQSRYQLSSAEIHTLARHLSGIPDSARKVPPGTIDETKLNEFMARYCGMSAYAKRQGVGYWRALGRLRRAKTELLKIPVAGSSARFVYFVPHQVRQPLAPSARDLEG